MSQANEKEERERRRDEGKECMCGVCGAASEKRIKWQGQ